MIALYILLYFVIGFVVSSLSLYYDFAPDSLRIDSPFTFSMSTILWPILIIGMVVEAYQAYIWFLIKLKDRRKSTKK